MTRVSTAMDIRSARSSASSPRIFASAFSCAQLSRPFFGHLGGASGLELLAELMMSRGSTLAGDL